MKKIILVFFLLIACQKPTDKEIRCWTCRWERVILSNQYYYSTVRDTCITESAKDDYESSGTFSNDKLKERVMCWKQGDPPLPNPGF